MKVYFRTDFNNKVGIGHLSRIYNLYLELKKIFTCKVIIDKKQKNLPFFKNSEDLIYLYDKDKFKNEKADASLFIKKSLSDKKNIIIVDDYRFGVIWEKKISKHAKKIIAIDDYIQKKHHVDILINTKPELLNIDLVTLEKIKKCNKSGAELLLGPKYSITNNFFNNRVEVKNKKKINITFYNGGAGDILIYKKIIKLILENQKNIIINLICGPFAKNVNSIISRYKKIKNVKIINNNDDFHKTLINTSLFIGSCGLISFETAKINLPSILIVMNKNQVINKNTLEEIGHYFVLKKEDIKNTKKFYDLSILCLKNLKRIKQMMKNSKFSLRNDGKKLIIESILKK